MEGAEGEKFRPQATRVTRIEDLLRRLLNVKWGNDITKSRCRSHGMKEGTVVV